MELRASGQWQVEGSCERDDEPLGCLWEISLLVDELLAFI